MKMAFYIYNIDVKHYDLACVLWWLREQMPEGLPEWADDPVDMDRLPPWGCADFSWQIDEKEKLFPYVGNVLITA